MNINQIKIFAVALFTLSFFAIAMFNTNSVSAVPDVVQTISNDDSAVTYKAKCAVCHSPKAEKSFDPAKKDDELAEAILKGKKAAKPPHMPEYETKGITKDQALELVAYMRKLKYPDAVSKDSTDAKDKAKEVTKERSREAIIGLYKKSCASCHGATAEKLYNPEMKEDEQAQIILKGKKGAKPPPMPGFEAKGVTLEQAKALSAYMIELRTPGN